MIPTKRPSSSSQIVRVGLPSTFMADLANHSSAPVLTCFETRQKSRRDLGDTYEIYRESVDGLPQFGPEADANPMELLTKGAPEGRPCFAMLRRRPRSLSRSRRRFS